MLLGFDPGRDKCGIAVTDEALTLQYHEVILAENAIATINELCQRYSIATLVMGNQTTSKQWKKRLETELETPVPIIAIDERNSTLEARDRYWQLFPPKGLKKLIPQGMRLPPRPIDDIVAILLIERYLQSMET
ncbi:MAG: pre-16S rRNA-processing nuclease YqgF [Microcystaceae cyanobacterium]